MNSSTTKITDSFVPSTRRLNIPGIGDRSISFGDKMFARLVMKGETIMEFMVTTVRDLSELFSLVHSKCRGLRGLAKLYLRNMSRGWCEERPLMLYPEPKTGFEYKRKYNAHPSTQVSVKHVCASHYFIGEARQLSFSWQL